MAVWAGSGSVASLVFFLLEGLSELNWRVNDESETTMNDVFAWRLLSFRPFNN
jgi:hypothetical protein